MTKRKDDGRYAALLPLLAVAAAWPAIWLAWIPLSHAAPDMRHAPRVFLPRVSYVWTAPGTADLPSSPMLIPLPAAAGAQTIRDDEPEVAPLAIAHMGAVHLPELTTVNLHLTPGITFEELMGRPAGTRNGYRHVSVDRPVYKRIGPDRARKAVQMSKSLRESGFEPGALIQECMTAVSNRCTASAYVETDGMGVVQRVFLETPTDDPKANDTFVRALMQGRTLKTGNACNGLVSITFPGTGL